MARSLTESMSKINVESRVGQCCPAWRRAAPLTQVLAYRIKNIHTTRKNKVLPVVEHSGRLVGIATRGDLKLLTPVYPLFPAQEDIRQALRALKVAEAMTVEPVVIGPEATLLEATKRLFEHGIGSLLVAEGNRLLGLLSVSDILRIVIEQHET